MRYIQRRFLLTGFTVATKTITIEVDESIYGLLEVLTHGEYAPDSVEGVVLQLIDRAQQGVYRPGAWERDWLCQAFGDDWTAYLEPGDPYGRKDCEHIFQRPKRRRSSRRSDA
jgi:hypothetical protein